MCIFSEFIAEADLADPTQQYIDKGAEYQEKERRATNRVTQKGARVGPQFLIKKFLDAAPPT